MAGLLYYLPGLDRSIKVEQAREAGLGYAFERQITANTYHGKGPFPEQGVTFADSATVQKVGCYPDQQTWRQAPGQQFWIGYYNDQRPGPADLARTRQLDGHLVRLADGNDWLIPVARGWNDADDESAGWYYAVPRLTDLDAEGNWAPGDVVPAYRRLWDLATGWWDTRERAAEAAEEGEERTTVDFAIDTFGGANDAAAFALGTNYRLSKFEIAALGLFDTQSAQAILDCVVDGPTFSRWLQKKRTEDPAPNSEPVGSPTGDGSSDVTPVTGQP
jgi:hypothetical protein